MLSGSDPTISRLASSRGLFVSCDENGALVFQKFHDSASPAAHIEYPGRIATDWSHAYDDTSRFYSYVAFAKLADGKQAQSEAFIDPQVPGARQMVFSADNAAENGILTALSWIHVSSLFLQPMRIEIPAVIVAISVGTGEEQSMRNAIPEVVTGGLNIAGGMIVVVGYAMVINMMRAGYLMPFFYLGFVTAAFTNFNLVALGVIGAVMAILYIQLSPKYNRVAGAPAQAAGNNDLDNELD